MALQEQELDIQYRPGKTNSRADALSGHPVPLQPEDCTTTQTPVLIAAMKAPLSPAQIGERGPDHTSLSESQLDDPQLCEIMQNLVVGELQTDNKQAQRILLGQSSFTMLDGVLYHIEEDKTQTKVHIQLSRHYWWPGMRRDISTWCRASAKCETRNVGLPVRPTESYTWRSIRHGWCRHAPTSQDQAKQSVLGSYSWTILPNGLSSTPYWIR